MAQAVGGVTVELLASAVKYISDIEKAARATEQTAKRMEAAFNQTAASISRLERQSSVAATGIAKISSTMGTISSAARLAIASLATLGITLGVQKIIQFADSWTLAEAQLKQVTGSATAATAVHERLFDVAQRLGIEIDSLTTIYSRTARAAGGLGITEEQVLEATEGLAAAIRVSGVAGEEAQRSIIQLSQAFALGVLRGQDLHSVASQMPVVLDAIAEATGKTRQEVIAFATQNGLAADLVIKALIRMKDKWTAQADTMASTVGQAVQRVIGAIERLAGVAEKAGAFNPLIESLNTLAASLSDPRIAASMMQLGGFIVSLASAFVTDLVPAIVKGGLALEAFFNFLDTHKWVPPDFSTLAPATTLSKIKDLDTQIKELAATLDGLKAAGGFEVEIKVGESQLSKLENARRDLIDQVQLAASEGKFGVPIAVAPQPKLELKGGEAPGAAGSAAASATKTIDQANQARQAIANLTTTTDELQRIEQEADNQARQLGKTYEEFAKAISDPVERAKALSSVLQAQSVVEEKAAKQKLALVDAFRQQAQAAGLSADVVTQIISGGTQVQPQAVLSQEDLRQIIERELGRPVLANPDGSFSTQELITVEMQGKIVNIPSIVGGKRVGQEEAQAAALAGKTQIRGPFASFTEGSKAAQAESDKIGAKIDQITAKAERLQATGIVSPRLTNEMREATATMAKFAEENDTALAGVSAHEAAIKEWAAAYAVLRKNAEEASATIDEIASLNAQAAAARPKDTADKAAAAEAEANQRRIDSLSRLPDAIDMASTAAGELSSVLSNVDNISFDNLQQSLADIAQSIAADIEKALIFQAIMAGVSALTPAPQTGAVGPGNTPGMGREESGGPGGVLPGAEAGAGAAAGGNLFSGIIDSIKGFFGGGVDEIAAQNSTVASQSVANSTVATTTAANVTAGNLSTASQTVAALTAATSNVATMSVATMTVASQVGGGTAGGEGGAGGAGTAGSIGAILGSIGGGTGGASAGTGAGTGREAGGGPGGTMPATTGTSPAMSTTDSTGLSQVTSMQVQQMGGPGVGGLIQQIVQGLGLATLFTSLFGSGAGGGGGGGGFLGLQHGGPVRKGHTVHVAERGKELFLPSNLPGIGAAATASITQLAAQTGLTEPLVRQVAQQRGGRQILGMMHGGGEPMAAVPAGVQVLGEHGPQRWTPPISGTVISATVLRQISAAPTGRKLLDTIGMQHGGPVRKGQTVAVAEDRRLEMFVPASVPGMAQVATAPVTQLAKQAGLPDPIVRQIAQERGGRQVLGLMHGGGEPMAAPAGVQMLGAKGPQLFTAPKAGTIISASVLRQISATAAGRKMLANVGRASGGPVDAGRTYVTGELGHELYVPSHAPIGLAAGGTMLPDRLYRVGERGPETLSTGTMAKVTPLNPNEDQPGTGLGKGQPIFDFRGAFSGASPGSIAEGMNAARQLAYSDLIRDLQRRPNLRRTVGLRGGVR